MAMIIPGERKRAKKGGNKWILSFKKLQEVPCMGIRSINKQLLDQQEEDTASNHWPSCPSQLL